MLDEYVPAAHSVQLVDRPITNPKEPIEQLVQLEEELAPGNVKYVPIAQRVQEALLGAP